MIDMAGLKDMLLDGDLAAELGLDPGLIEQLLQGAGMGNLTPEQLQQLADMMQALQGDMLEMMENLEFVELVDPKMLQACQGCTNCNTAALAAFLAQEGDCSLDEALQMIGMPGRGGVNRGRGDAPMTWSGGTSEENIDFKEEALPPAGLADLKKTRLVGVSTTAPELTGEGEGTGSGALAGSRAGPGSANVHKVLPRHKAATTRYFDR